MSTAYTTQIAVKICNRIADGDSVRQICRDDGMPSKSTVFVWLAQNPEFVTMYEAARMIQADACFDEILEIADDGTNDWMEKNDPKNPGYSFNGEAFGRSRLRVDTRKWKLARMNAKKYGERVEHAHGGTDSNAIVHEIVIRGVKPETAA